MEHPELEEELLEEVKKAKGPAQKLAAIKSLADLYGNENFKERQIRYLLMCLEISNGDDKLWRELGDIWLSSQRLQLADYAYKAAVKLKNNSENLYSLALSKALSYDYINSLAILNYLIDSQAYEPAQSLKCYVKSKLNPGEIVDFPEKIIWPKAKSVDPYKQITKKAFNLHGLIIQTRIMVDKGMWEYKVKFEVANYEFDKKNPVVKSTTVTQNPCNDFCESLKSLVLKDINHTFLAIVWNKSFQVSFVSTKISSLLEDGIKHLFGRFILLRQMCDSLFDVLLRNNPRPSTMLTPEIGCEILHIYFLCETWIDLKDEYLTLLEISNEEKYKDEHIINFRNKAISSIPDFDIQELRARSYAALAFSHFKSRTAFEKNRDEYIQELMRVEHMAEKAINELQGATIYLWWTDTYLNEDVLNKLRKDVKIDYALLDLEKLTKSATKTAEPILRVLETWSKLLYAHAANDDPLFYWKKMKIQLKYLSKFNLSASERNQLLSIMARYVSVLLFNAEDGIPLKKEYDLPILMKIITKQLSPFFDLDKAEICKLTISVLNLMKYSPRLFNQMPFFLKRVYKGLDCTKLPVIFEIFHNNIQKFTGNLESDFHMKLCNKFEKICFEQNSEKLLKIIYRWNYGLMNGKTCKCTAKFPSNILTLPNSPEKLDRFLKFSDQTDDQEQFGFNSPQMYQDKKMYNMLRELVEKEPKLFIDCPKHGNFKKMLESSDIVTNLNCCNPIKRAIAAETFKRLACYKCDFKAKLDAKKRFDNLKEGKNFIINAIELNPTDPELWLILGQLQMWKWIYGYFDLFNFSDKINAKSEDLTEAIQAFKLASKFSNSKYAYEAISVLYYFSSLIYKDSLNEAIQNVAKAHSMFTFHSELILIIYGLLLLKNKDPECLNILKGLSPYAEIANYKIHRDINSIGIISTSTDSYCQYLYNKQNGSLFSLLNNQYLPWIEFKTDYDILNAREIFNWKIIDKVGMKCLKQIKEESSKDKLIAVIDIFLAQKYQCRRNKVLSKIFMAYLEELIVMGHKEIADSYTDKIPFLTHQEKKNIKKLL